MPGKKSPSPPPPRGARKPGEVLALAATMLVAALALNAPAMLRSAEKLDFAAPERAPALRALTPGIAWPGGQLLPWPPGK